MDVSHAIASITQRIDGLDEWLPVVEILRTTTEVIGSVVPFDGCAVTSTDPETMLPAHAAYVTGFPAWSCGPYWDHEFLVPDVLSFASVHGRGGRPRTLHRETGGDLRHSRRHRELLRNLGMGPQLRTTLSTTRGCYGLVDLVRGEDLPDFTEDELAVVDMVRPMVTDRLRTAIARRPRDGEAAVDHSAVVIVDDDGEILSMTPQAQELLSRIPEAINTDDSSALLNATVHAIWARARFIAGGFDAPPASTRIVLAGGQRVTLRATCTRTEEGRMGHTVLTMEPTRNSELGPLVLAAHELTPRQEEVVQMLLRGDSPQQISSRLGISLHTVRAHTKSIHEKMGISSRAELSRLFIDEEFLSSADIVATTGSAEHHQRSVPDDAPTPAGG